MSTPRRFWIEFDPAECADVRLWEGVGVTGFDVADCLSMVAEMVWDGPLPPVRRIVADVSLAEPLPVRRGLGVSVWRGVWYPAVNLALGPARAIDRRGAPADYPAPVTRSRPVRVVAGRATWWDEIPHIAGLRWPLVRMQCAENRSALAVCAGVQRDACTRDPTYGAMVREALDYMIAWRPTPEEWFEPTGTSFADQQDVDEYLRAFRDYLVGDRPEPIIPAGGEP
ncbi:hypothetical protein [Nocardia lasii]|uniref:Uncharacterized protein n=1 Tax=Nocardia lasii TaxID=1616107 RepID=A0ABW1JMF6_9NOCA